MADADGVGDDVIGGFFLILAGRGVLLLPPHRMASLPVYSGVDCTLSPPWSWICQGKCSMGHLAFRLRLPTVHQPNLVEYFVLVYCPHLRLRLSAHLQHHHRKASDAIVGARMVQFFRVQMNHRENKKTYIYCTMNSEFLNPPTFQLLSFSACVCVCIYSVSVLQIHIMLR